MRFRHASFSVKGALVNWCLDDFEGAFMEQDGRVLTPAEAKLMLADLLEEGTLFLPMLRDGEACDGWSDKTGCPGHDVPPLLLPAPAVDPQG